MDDAIDCDDEGIDDNVDCCCGVNDDEAIFEEFEIKDGIALDEDEDDERVVVLKAKE